ncbi:inorganic phosphate transporter [Granulosicoccus antarcticus]|uniref:Phosphate transporter n=1 Tax=Granulosicoccus antarcticus IMCC3135 TaxID=1192854 RepID=A0A2Z2P0U8_9GAMM|nr:inorganic phosphate transporter [Granulosicoccus antarcticus]ASJ74820.1 Sulfate permease CysP [Granulosicoccus antarcticus IMCC3135]
MELEKIAEIEHATSTGRHELFRLGTALLFIVGIVLFVGSLTHGVNNMLVIAAMIGGYMALNIGANDVANNVGPAVGSNALTLTGAILIAVIFEAAGALIAGGDVVGTIKSGIINPDLIADTDTFIWVMTAALLAGALWLNLATVMGAPVSTTHSIVGGVLGAGIAAGGLGIADWGKVSQIVISWLISPLMGGIIAASFLYLIKRTIMYQEDRVAAAKRIVPLLIGFMAWAFGTYLVLKGLKKIWKTDLTGALLVGLAIGLIVLLISKVTVRRSAKTMDNSKEAIDKLFMVPLIFAAALLSFAHGANDVANAVGPLAAISEAISTGQFASEAHIPVWVMLIGACGIALGLALYGPKLIRTVGSEITELNQTRAYCIALSAAITVIIATHFGLPVSSTHIAVGAVFGVGFLREYIKSHYAGMVVEIEHHHQGADHEEIEAYLAQFEAAPLAQKGHMIRELKRNKGSIALTKKERRTLKKTYRHELVKRSALLKIAAAWVITVPVSGLLAAMLFFTIKGMML